VLLYLPGGQKRQMLPVEKNRKDLVRAFKEAAEQAKSGADSTKKMVAKFGRAKQFGEKSIGIPDAGAMSMYFIFKAMSDWLGMREK